MQVKEVEPTTVATTQAGIRASRALSEPAATHAAEPAATVQLKPGTGVTVETADDEATLTRAEQIEELPEFGEITGLKAVDSGISLNMVPLRSGRSLAAAYFDEGTNVSAIMGKTINMRDGVDKAISAHSKGWDLGQASVGGRVDLVAMRCSEPFRNGRCASTCRMRRHTLGKSCPWSLWTWSFAPF